MKPVINSLSEIECWLQSPLPAIFKGQDLRRFDGPLSTQPLLECVFLGCRMGLLLASAAAEAQCLIIPIRPGLSFNPFSPGLYTPEELYDRFDPDAPIPDITYRACLDRQIYESFMNPLTRQEWPVDVDIQLMRRIHDSSMTDSLNERLDAIGRQRCVAIMGGHNRGRDEPIYRRIAHLALTLTQADYFIVTGGGPGLMEAANLGAWCAGYDTPALVLDQALASLAAAPRYDHPGWLTTGYSTWKSLGTPPYPEKGRSLGIPTWFYGHEPPNVFATDIAKYFENSVREEGLLAISQGGIIFADGNAGTVQELFQDANQNYYRTYGQSKSPMILFEPDYWNPGPIDLQDPAEIRKPAYPLLMKLAHERHFADYVFLSHDSAKIVEFLRTHPPVR